MRMFGLHPDDVLARTPAAEIARRRVPSLGFSVGYGAISMALVSTLAYSVWAFRLIRGEPMMYAAVALVYIILTGLALHRLILAPRSRGAFALLFGAAFLAYAVIWSAFWFGLRGRHLADLWGAAAGLGALTLVLGNALGGAHLWRAWLAAFALHSAGYYLGGVLYGSIAGPAGKLLWGTAHGLGFGAGLGFVLFHVQGPLKNRLPRA